VRHESRFLAKTLADRIQHMGFWQVAFPVAFSYKQTSSSLRFGDPAASALWAHGQGAAQQKFIERAELAGRQ
jgi:hypothetical protein